MGALRVVTSGENRGTNLGLGRVSGPARLGRGKNEFSPPWRGGRRHRQIFTAQGDSLVAVENGWARLTGFWAGRGPSAAGKMHHRVNLVLSERRASSGRAIGKDRPGKKKTAAGRATGGGLLAFGILLKLVQCNERGHWPPPRKNEDPHS